jgi:hypothetical protein
MDKEKEKEMNVDVVDTTEDQPDEERRMEERTPESAPRTGTTSTSSDKEDVEALFNEADAKKFQSRWLDIQSKFVDDPRDAVKQADDLVADTLKSITMNFSNRRVALEQQWNGGKDVSTEDLRMALKSYRSFFQRLLSLQS